MKAESDEGDNPLPHSTSFNKHESTNETLIHWNLPKFAPGINVTEDPNPDEPPYQSAGTGTDGVEIDNPEDYDMVDLAESNRLFQWYGVEHDGPPCVGDPPDDWIPEYSSTYTSNKESVKSEPDSVEKDGGSRSEEPETFGYEIDGWTLPKFCPGPVHDDPCPEEPAYVSPGTGTDGVEIDNPEDYDLDDMAKNKRLFQWYGMVHNGVDVGPPPDDWVMPEDWDENEDSSQAALDERKRRRESLKEVDEENVAVHKGSKTE